MICACCLFVSAFSQTNLSITTEKTTSLIFPFPVKHVDRGSKEVLVQQVKEADNILLVKAATVKLAETNLTVVIGDGSVYSFCVNFRERPELLIVRVPVLQNASIQSYAEGILDNSLMLRGPKDDKWGMQLRVTGIYIKDDVMYYQLRLSNYSPIDYDIDLLRFYVHDQKRSKRTAVQEVEKVPLFIAGNTKVIRANSVSAIVLALDKFTIPDAKLFAIQVMERHGGRHLSLNVKNNHIVKAKVLPDMK